jgi:hypothetical protein
VEAEEEVFFEGPEKMGFVVDHEGYLRGRRRSGALRIRVDG